MNAQTSMDGLVIDVGWIIAAFAAGMGAKALRLPPLVGYLAAGMTLAVFGVQAGPVVGRVGELGVALLLFLVGTNLRWKNLLRLEVLGAGGAHLVIFTALGALGGWLLGLSPAAAGVVAASLGVSSLVLAAKALEAQNDLSSYHGRIVIGITLLQTVAATALIAGMGTAPSPWALLLLGLPLLQPPVQWVLGRMEDGELLVLFGLAAAAAGAIGFEVVGLSAELGALAAGALVAGHDAVDDLGEALAGLKDAFLAAFFLSVGLVGVPSWAGLAVVGGLTLFLLVKAALFFGLLVGFRLRARTAFLAAIPLTTYSGFTLIVGTAAVEAGLLPAEALTVLAVATAASYLVNAPVARQTPALWRRVEGWLGGWERSGDHPEAVPQTLGRVNFLVAGMGRAGTAAYDYLGSMMQCTVGMDDNPAHLARHREAGRRVVYGDARDGGLWRDLDLSGVEAVLLAIPGREAKLDAIRGLRAAGFDGAISTLTADPEAREALMEAGANAVYLSIHQAGRALAAYGLKRRSDPAPDAVTLQVSGHVPERHAA